jgi:AraC-like DNA-binding protein
VTAATLASEPLILSANIRRAAACIQFMKDAGRHYVAGNRGLAAFFGQTSIRPVIGQRTSDFFDDEIVRRYDELDAVISDGYTLIDRFDYTYDHSGHCRWFLYARCRFERDGEAFARGISYPLPDNRQARQVYRRLDIATRTISDRLDVKLDVGDIAEAAACSVAQLERDFNAVLAQTPKQYRARLRVQRAIDAIRAGRSLTDAALEAGYSEHSALTRAFKAATGLTPRDFRATLS